MASGQFAEKLVKLAASQICVESGFQTADARALDTLADVTSRFIEEIGRLAVDHSTYYGRTDPNLDDIGQALILAGMDISSIPQWMDLLTKQTLIFEVAPFPTPLEALKVHPDDVKVVADKPGEPKEKQASNLEDSNSAADKKSDSDNSSVNQSRAKALETSEEVTNFGDINASNTPSKPRPNLKSSTSLFDVVALRVEQDKRSVEHPFGSRRKPIAPSITLTLGNKFKNANVWRTAGSVSVKSNVSGKPEPHETVSANKPFPQTTQKRLPSLSVKLSTAPSSNISNTPDREGVESASGGSTSGISTNFTSIGTMKTGKRDSNIIQQAKSNYLQSSTFADEQPHPKFEISNQSIVTPRLPQSSSSSNGIIKPVIPSNLNKASAKTPSSMAIKLKFAPLKRPPEAELQASHQKKAKKEKKEKKAKKEKKEKMEKVRGSEFEGGGEAAKSAPKFKQKESIGDPSSSDDEESLTLRNLSKKQKSIPRSTSKPLVVPQPHAKKPTGEKRTDSSGGPAIAPGALFRQVLQRKADAAKQDIKQKSTDKQKLQKSIDTKNKKLESAKHKTVKEVKKAPTKSVKSKAAANAAAALMVRIPEADAVFYGDCSAPPKVPSSIDELYCICGRSDDYSTMVACDDCDAWYHWVCLGRKASTTMDVWMCPKCIAKKSTSSYQMVDTVWTSEESRSALKIVKALLSNVDYGRVFKDVPDNEIAPGYTETIWMPMGLAVIVKRLEVGKYYYFKKEHVGKEEFKTMTGRIPTYRAFHRDIMIIAENCRVFNLGTIDNDSWKPEKWRLDYVANFKKLLDIHLPKYASYFDRLNKEMGLLPATQKTKPLPASLM